MEKPWKVIGWERVMNQNGKLGVRIFAVRELITEGDGEGQEAGRIYINPEYCKYDPVIGQLIIPVEGRFGVDKIIVVG